MKISFRLLACASLLLLSAGIVQAQNLDCRNVQFSDDILSRFPQAPDACLDVIQRGGEEFAVFKVRLDRVVGNSVHVRFNKPDGSRGPLTRIPTQPDFRVLVDGKPTRVSDLALNQELTAYVQVSRPMVALAPASETQTLAIVPIFAAGEEAPGEEDESTAQLSSLPNTAGSAALLALLGLACLAAAGGLHALRRRGWKSH